MCIVDEETKVTRSGRYSASFLSGHDLIDISLNIGKSCELERRLKCRNINAINEYNFRRDIFKSDWHLFFNSNDIDVKLQSLNNNLTYVLDKHGPLRVKTYKWKPNAWITVDIKRRIYVSESECDGHGENIRSQSYMRNSNCAGVQFPGKLEKPYGTLRYSNKYHS